MNAAQARQAFVDMFQTNTQRYKFLHIPHDGGWYIQRTDNWQVSVRMFPTKQAAETVLLFAADTIEWME